jgi:hypothetical protein
MVAFPAEEGTSDDDPSSAQEHEHENEDECRRRNSGEDGLPRGSVLAATRVQRLAKRYFQERKTRRRVLKTTARIQKDSRHMVFAVVMAYVMFMAVEGQLPFSPLEGYYSRRCKAFPEDCASAVLTSHFVLCTAVWMVYHYTQRRMRRLLVNMLIWMESSRQTQGKAVKGKGSSRQTQGWFVENFSESERAMFQVPPPGQPLTTARSTATATATATATGGGLRLSPPDVGH